MRDGECVSCLRCRALAPGNGDPSASTRMEQVQFSTAAGKFRASMSVTVRHPTLLGQQRAVHCSRPCLCSRRYQAYFGHCLAFLGHFPGLLG